MSDLPNCYRCASQPCICKDGITLYHGDCREVMAGMESNSVEAVVTDPPYGLTANKKGGSGEASLNLKSPAGRSRATTGGFMGCKWDSGVPDVDVWLACLRVLKHGGHLLAFGGTRTFHRLTCAIEDAGFEIRDCVMWLHSQGFPKSLDVSKAIDYRVQGQMRRDAVQAVIDAGLDLPDRSVCDWTKEDHAPGNKWWARFVEWIPALSDEIQNRVHRAFLAKGYSGATAFWNTEGGMGDFNITAPATEAAKQWDGWGTSLKPAWEPIIVARKPLDGTVAANVLEHGVGGLNIDGCRVGTEDYYSVPQADFSASSERGSMMQGAAQDSYRLNERAESHSLGRWPANLILSHHPECVEVGTKKVKANKEGKGILWSHIRDDKREHASPKVATHADADADGLETIEDWQCHPDCPIGMFPSTTDSGSAARFFYTAKASKADRTPGNDHPTVKPVNLMRWLIRLVCPMGGTVLDPFNGSGTTTYAAREEHCRATGIEQEEKWVGIAASRLKQGVLF